MFIVCRCLRSTTLEIVYFEIVNGGRSHDIIEAILIIRMTRWLIGLLAASSLLADEDLSSLHHKLPDKNDSMRLRLVSGRDKRRTTRPLHVMYPVLTRTGSALYTCTCIHEYAQIIYVHICMNMCRLYMYLYA